jgi:hypothetical protein
MDEPERRDDGVADPEVAIEDQRSPRLHERACGTFPGGVSHTTRYTDPNPLYMESATGAHVRDADGNEYVDFWMNHFASVLGHSHPNVVEAVTAQARNWFNLETVNERALELGERIPEYVPSAERVRLCVSGTEATMYAVRLARAYTGRRQVLKVEGGWHGGNTDLSVDVHAPFDGPETDGLSPGAADHVHSFPYNDSSALRRLLDEYEGDVAAVVVEPLRGALCVEAAALEALCVSRRPSRSSARSGERPRNGTSFSSSTRSLRASVSPREATRHGSGSLPTSRGSESFSAAAYPSGPSPGARTCSGTRDPGYRNPRKSSPAVERDRCTR